MRAKRLTITCSLLAALGLPAHAAAAVRAEPGAAAAGGSPEEGPAQEPAPPPDGGEGEEDEKDKGGKKPEDEPGDEPGKEPSAPAPEPPGGGEEIQGKLQGVQDIEDVDLTDLLRPGITGVGAERGLDEAAGAVTVVGEEEIRRLGARTLEDVLETVAGFEVTTDALGRGSIVVRGIPAAPGSGGSDGVLVLLNGHRLNDALRGATAVNLAIPVDNVKRIEIRRSPAPVLDGRGAFLAVVNIVTETADTFRKDELSLGGGSFSTLHYNFRYGTTVRGVSLTGFLQYERTQGPDLDLDADAQTVADRLAGDGVPPISRAPGRLDDDRKSVDANLALVYKNLTLNGRLKEENAGGFLGLLDVLGSQNRLSNKQVLVDADYYHPLGGSGSLRARLSFAESQMAEFLDVLPAGFTVTRPDTPTFVFQTGVFFQRNLNSRRLGGELVLERRLFEGNTLVAGLGLDRESTFDLRALSNLDVPSREPLPAFQPIPEIVPAARRRVQSGFVQDTWSRGPATVEAGLRVDDYSDATTAVSPRASLAWRLPRSLRVRAGYARSVRVPTFSELYYGSAALNANPDLEPETLDSVEAALTWRQRGLRLTASAYRWSLRDRVVVLPPPAPTGPRSLVNTDGADAHGVEVSLGHGGAGRSFHLSYALQRPEDRRTGERLAGVPSHLGALGGAFGLGPRLIVAPELLVRGGRGRDPGDPRAGLDGYALANLTLRFRTLGHGLELSAAVQNIFDRRYFDPAPAGGLPGDYPRPGRSLFVKARYRF